MKMIGRIVLALCLFGFFMVGILLFTMHGGVAIKASNYLFFGIVFGMILKYLANE